MKLTEEVLQKVRDNMKNMLNSYCRSDDRFSKGFNNGIVACLAFFDEAVNLDKLLAESAVASQPNSIVPKWAGQFVSFTQWVHHAQSRLQSSSQQPAVCIDAKGRRCSTGKDFMRARDEGTFPVRYFWEFEVCASNECGSVPHEYPKISAMLASGTGGFLDAEKFPQVFEQLGMQPPNNQPNLICKSCGVDRSKEDCKGDRLRCGLASIAHSDHVAVIGAKSDSVHLDKPAETLTDTSVTADRFFIDHDMIHDRLTGRHVHGCRDFDMGAADEAIATLNALHRRAETVDGLVKALQDAIQWIESLSGCNNSCDPKADTSELQAIVAKVKAPSDKEARFRESFFKSITSD